MVAERDQVWMGQRMEVVSSTSCVVHEKNSVTNMPARRQLIREDGVETTGIVPAAATLFSTEDVEEMMKKRKPKAKSVTKSNEKEERKQGRKRKRNNDFNGEEDTNLDLESCLEASDAGGESDFDHCDDDEDWVFVPVSRPRGRHSVPYWDLIGHRFHDSDENKTFTIECVCKTSNHSSYFFQYREDVCASDSETHHTPCVKYFTKIKQYASLVRHGKSYIDVLILPKQKFNPRVGF